MQPFSEILSTLDWSDPRLWWIAGVALLAGFVRGFTGFGAGMIFIPAASAIYDPVVAIVLLFLIDTAASIRSCRRISATAAGARSGRWRLRPRSRSRSG